jgi:hypothetical protein
LTDALSGDSGASEKQAMASLEAVDAFVILSNEDADGACRSRAFSQAFLVGCYVIVAAPLALLGEGNASRDSGVASPGDN